MTKAKFYAVRKGRQPGIYDSWVETKAQINGFSSAQHKAFKTRQEAEQYLNEAPAPAPTAAPVPPAPPITTIPPRRREVTSDIEQLRRVEPLQDPRNDLGGFTQMEYYQAMLNLDSRITDDEEYRCEHELVIIFDPYGDSEMRALLLRHDGGGSFGVQAVYVFGTNSRYGAAAGVGVYYGPHDARNVARALDDNRNTLYGNQRATLHAAIDALEQARADRPAVLRVYSGLEYAVKCLTDWGARWARNGFRTAKGGPVKNEDLITHGLRLLKELAAAGMDVGVRLLTEQCVELGRAAWLARRGARGQCPGYTVKQHRRYFTWDEYDRMMAEEDSDDNCMLDDAADDSEDLEEDDKVYILK